MEITKENYLSRDEIETLITSGMPNKKAEILALKLDKMCFLKDSKLYVLKKNLTYSSISKQGDIDKEIYTVVTKLIEESFESLPAQDKENIKLKHGKIVIWKNADVSTYLPQLMSNITNEDIKLDNYTKQIHFKNGYVDLNTLELKKRVVNIDFITTCINRDYEKSSADEQNMIMSYIKMIYPDEKDMECILLTLGSAISGESTDDQNSLFLIGEGSSGKSFVLTLTQLSVEVYLQELQSNTFTVGNSKIDKILNSFIKSPHVRIAWVNEMEDKKIDGNLYKNICDGKVHTTTLYEDCQKTVIVKFKTITTSQTMPNLISDSGSTRRINSYTHMSKFVDDVDDSDKSKHIYVKNKKLLKEITTSKNLLNAWFDILSNYCKKWIDGEQIIYSSNFVDTKESVVGSNDIFQDFIDSRLTITKDPMHKIGKNRMHALFSQMYTDKHLTSQQVISSMKDHKIEYSGTHRCNNIKGCFLGVREKEDKEEDPTNHGVDETDKSIKYDVELKKENDKLREELVELKKLLKKQQDPIVEVVEVKVIEDKVTEDEAPPKKSKSKSKSKSESKSEEFSKPLKKKKVAKVDVREAENFGKECENFFNNLI